MPVWKFHRPCIDFTSMHDLSYKEILIYERRSRALPISISTEPTNTVPQSDSELIQLVKHVTSIEISIR